jgi:hypothetical protein
MVEQSQSVPTDKHHPLTDQAQKVPRKLPDDMIDTPSDCARWPLLAKFRGEGRDSLLKLYLASDDAAQHAQGVHKIWVGVSACSATLALSLAFVELP